MAHLNVQIDTEVTGDSADELASVLEAFSERIRETAEGAQNLIPGEWGTLLDGDNIAGRWWMTEA